MEEDEQFIGFADFNSFEEIDFYPKNLHVECCSYFLYMSKQTDQVTGIVRNRLKLLLLDPFVAKLEGVLFSSSTYFDNQLLKQSDMLLKSIIQNNKKNKNDENYSLYIWSQIPDNLVRSKMMEQKANQINKGEDSDQNQEKETYLSKALSDDTKKYNVCENIPFISDSKGFIYYLQIEEGQYKIMEGNPKDPYLKHHQCIFTDKIHNCLAFDYENGSFYIMDGNHVTKKLTRNENQRLLNIESQTTLKEVQKLDYNPKSFDSFILRERYSVYQSKLFYFSEIDKDEPPQGILEAESLNDEESGFSFHSGPFLFRGSYRFYGVYTGNGFISFARVHLLPDKTQATLINDFQNCVDMSTFLNSGIILIKIRARFMIYTEDGVFISEVKFDDTNASKIEKKVRELDDENYHYEVTVKTLKAHQKERLQKDKVVQCSQQKDEQEKVRDFNGMPYNLQIEEHQEYDRNARHLIQFSENNKFFLFYKEDGCQLVVYELTQLNNEGNIQYQFILKYLVNVEDSLLFNRVYKETDVDLVEYYTRNPNQVSVDNEGRIKLCFSILLREAIHSQMSGNKPHTDHSKGKHIHSELNNYECLGAIFQEGYKKHGTRKYTSICYNFNEQFFFPGDIQDKKDWLIHSQKNEVITKINCVRVNQSRLPSILRDYTEYDNLIRDLRNLEKIHKDYMICNLYFTNLVVVRQGHYLIYGSLQKKKKVDTFQIQSGHAKEKSFNLHYEFQNVDAKEANKAIRSLSKYFTHHAQNYKMKTMSCNFDHTVAIQKVIETSKSNCLNIIAKDYISNIIFVLTWDFNINSEISSYQIQDQSIYRNATGNHVFKGLNNKMNYFQDSNYLIDLEHNIPIKQKNVNQGLDQQKSYTKQVTNLLQYYNQKKSNKKNDKQLGVEKPSCLYFTLTRMDIQLWKNISELGESLQVISQSIELMDFNNQFGGTSLFHHFSKRPDVIEFIYNLLAKTLEENGELTATEESLPLQILNPNKFSITAVDCSIISQSPKVFELMINMLKPFQNLCVSKMLLRSLSRIIQHPSQNVIDFLGDNLYIPPQMAVEFFINWNDDSDEFCFPSHTSVVSKSLLDHWFSQNESKEENIEDDIQKNKTAKKLKMPGSQSLEMVLGKDLETSNQRRVQVEALDIDWLFTNNNCKRLIELLVSEEANENILTEKQIRAFVKLIWVYYQPQIIWKILIPYAVYLILLLILSGNIIEEWFINIEYLLQNPHDIATYDAQFWVNIEAYMLTSVSILIMMFFGIIELHQLYELKLAYFNDFWNNIDMLSLIFNYWFLMMFLVDLILQEGFFDGNFIQSVASWSMFWMWIKVFYWFRLFERYATYIKLIVQTIYDMRYFFYMVLIILLAFGNFMYVAESTLEGEVDSTGTSLTLIDTQYAPKTFNFVNSVLSVYMFGALKQFSQQTYITGFMHYSTSALFILGTFLVSVIFMNMLIAIMMDTFAQVMNNNEINTIKENVIMISDYKWLVDLDQVFYGYKYIIRVSPTSGSMKYSNDDIDVLWDVCYHTEKNISLQKQEQQQRLDFIDQSTRYQLKYQLENLKQMMETLNNIDERMKQEANQKKPPFDYEQIRREQVYTNLSGYLDKKFFKKGDQKDQGALAMFQEKFKDKFKENLISMIQENDQKDFDKTQVRRLLSGLVGQDEHKIPESNIEDVCAILNINITDEPLKLLGHMLQRMFPNEATGVLTDFKLREIALELLANIDISKSGQIEFNEFYEFFSKLDDFEVSNELMQTLFQKFDKENSSSISIEEFAQAIKYSLQSAQNRNKEKDKSSSEDESY